MASPPPPPSDGGWSTDTWVAVALGGASVLVLLLGAGYMACKRYSPNAQASRGSVMSTRVPAQRSQDANGFGPSALFAVAPGECAVDMPLPLLGL